MAEARGIRSLDSMKEVKSISLALENCESIPIDRKHVGEFLCNNIASRVLRIACNSIANQQLCDELFVEINKDANVKYSCFGQESEEPAFDRLTKCPDVVGVEIVYEDDSSDYLLVPWNEDNDYANKYQSTYVSKCGHLYLMVSKTRTVQDLLKGQDVDDWNRDWPWT